MNQYSKTSQKRLESCHKDLQLVFNTVLETYDHAITYGHRTEEQQMEMFENKLSKLAWPLSKHNKIPSEAIDAAPWPIQWNNTKRFYHFAGYVLGVAERLQAEGKISHAIRWGGDWDSDNDLDDQIFMDLVHFELVPL